MFVAIADHLEQVLGLGYRVIEDCTQVRETELVIDELQGASLIAETHMEVDAQCNNCTWKVFFVERMCLSSVETGKSVDVEHHSINDVSEQQSKVRYKLAFQVVVPGLVSSIPCVVGKSALRGEPVCFEVFETTFQTLVAWKGVVHGQGLACKPLDKLFVVNHTLGPLR